MWNNVPYKYDRPSTANCREIDDGLFYVFTKVNDESALTRRLNLDLGGRRYRSK